MPAAIISKEQVLDRLMQAFRTYGYDGATLTRLTAATGLVRASLYNYFPGGKPAMGAAVLDHAGVALERLVLSPLRASEAPEARIAKMVAGLKSFYSGGSQACLLGLLSIGEGHELFETRIRLAFDRWIDAIAGALVEAGVPPREAKSRAEDAIGAIQGALVLCRARNERGPFDRVVRSLPDRLFAGR